MKIIKNLIAIICFVIIMVGNSNISFAEVADEPYIKEINIKPDIRFINGFPPAIGCASEVYSAETVMSDESVVNDKKYKDMYWKLERYNNVDKTYTLVEKSEGEYFYLWLPYGTKEGQYKLTATSKVDSNVSGYIWKYMGYSNLHKNFCVFQKGKVKHGKIRGNELGAGKVKVESYNPEDKTYTSIIPKCPYKTKDYIFIGWMTEGKIYYPGEKFVASRDKYRHVYFEAQWKPKFEKPDMVANRVGTKKIKLKWNRMVGGDGYKIYRSTKKNGKYKLVKTLRKKLETTWTETTVEKGKVYYYKVATYKRLKEKLIQKQSSWTMASTRAAKVTKVNLNKTSIAGVKGENTTVKAILNTGKGQKLSNKVRWYTSNNKVSKINQKTGKITFIKRGVCYIWAKAYNGKKSVKVKVIVK